MSRRSLVALGASAAVGTPVALPPTPTATASAPRLSVLKLDGREMPYAWRPARTQPARTLVWLHGRTNNRTPTPIVAPGWNVLVPLDRYGPQGAGSWWLGEGGDWSTLRLLHLLIGRVRRRLGGDQGLYLAGSSMGGYGALLHGILLGAEAVYANAFQSRLRGVGFPGQGIEEVLGWRATAYADVPGMVARAQAHDLPWMMLGFNRFDSLSVDYYGDHFAPLVDALHASGAMFGSEVVAAWGHNQTLHVSQVVRLFDANRGAIEAWQERD